MKYGMIQELLSISGLFWSLVLIYVALTKSPTVMRPCVIMIVIKCITDLAASMVNYFLSERLITTGNVLYIIAEGPCRFTSYETCFSSHMLLFSLLQQNLVWLMCSYLFRFYILNYHDPALKIFLLTAIVVYIPSLALSVYWMRVCYEWIQFNERHAPKMFAKPEDLAMAGAVIHQSGLVTCVILLVLSTLGLLVYFCISYMMWKFLKERTSRLSKIALVLNTQLVKVIHFQALIPFLTISGISTLILMHYYVVDPIRIQALPSVFFSTTLSIFPLSYIFFMPPYFNFCLGNPKKEVTRRIKARLKMGSTVELAHSTAGVYPLTTF